MANTLNAQVEQLCGEFAQRLTALFRSEVQSIFEGTSRAPTPTPIPRPVPLVKRTVTPLNKGVVKKRATPPHCLAPDCPNPHGGPKNSFLCAEHRHLFTRVQSSAFLQAWKASSK